MLNKCPDCGNTNESRMAMANKGKRIYCLECHYSFSPNAQTPFYRKHNRPGKPQSKVKASPLTPYGELLVRIEQLERYVANLQTAVSGLSARTQSMQIVGTNHAVNLPYTERAAVKSDATQWYELPPGIKL